MAILLPAKLPASASSVSQSAPIANPGGYDILIGDVGFRLATDTNRPFRQFLDSLSSQRPDTVLDANATRTEALPWVKGQVSFHGGAGQVNLEQESRETSTTVEQVSHLRYDSSLGVDVWTPGQIQRLPDTTIVDLDFTATCLVAGTVDGVDYAIVAGDSGKLSQIAWLSGIDSDATVTAISGVTGDVISLATDGIHYYALVSGDTSYVLTGGLDSTDTPSTLYTDTDTWVGVLGWSKERLMLGANNSVYELDITASSAALPTAKYTHPVTSATFTAIGESPSGVLIALLSGRSPSVIQLALDSSGATPTLTGGATVLTLPPGETIYAMQSYLGSFLAVATDRGVQVGTFDTYTGDVTLGPLSLTTDKPVRTVVGRDRFIFAGYSDGQADGTTGLARIDLSMKVDDSGRNAWAPDLRPPSTAATGKGTVTGVALAPFSNRLLFTSDDGLHIEGDGPGSDGKAWLETSRIRYFTAEKKLFTRGSIHGQLKTDEARVTVLGPYDTASVVGTFGYTSRDSEFALLSDTSPWIKLKFELLGSTAVLNSYQVKALPAPSRPMLSQFSVNCFQEETDKFGATALSSPLERWQYVSKLAKNLTPVRFVQFTNSAPIVQTVTVDTLIWESDSPPHQEDSLGGYITFQLREL